MITQEEGMIQRIKELIEKSGFKKTRFAIEVGINSSNFSKKLEGRLGFSDNDIKLISTKTGVRKGWLLTGEGQMFKAPEEMREAIPAQSRNTNKNEGIPLIPTNAMAGGLSGTDCQFMPYEIETRFIVPTFSKSDFCIRVDGNSMEPTYYKGDIIACRYVPMSGLWFQWGKVYTIATNQGVLVKHIEQGSDSEHIRLVSDNPAYKPFEIPISDIYSVAIINGLIRVE